MHNTRRNILKRLSLAGVWAGLGMPALGAAPTHQFKQTDWTGADDRAYWAKLLHKIARPVVENLAEGTLKARMPMEVAPNYTLKVEKVTHLEAIGRTVAGLAPWLELPDDATEEGAMRRVLKAQLLKGLPHCVDPNSPDCLNFKEENQPIVDAAFLAHGFLRAPQSLWHPLDETTKQRFIQAFIGLRNRKASYSNWLLFSAIIETFLLSINASYDPVRIDYALRKMKEWYVGDGWYSDGPKFSMDYYNSFVIHPMLVDVLKVCLGQKIVMTQDYDDALRRMLRHAEFLERMISPEGTFPIFGRSMTYRAGAFQALAQTALMEQLPWHIAPAQVRCGLTKVLQNLFDQNQNFDPNGWLVLGFNGAQPMIADTYTSTGSLYLTTLAFLPLGLPPNNRFWTDPPADWSAKKAWSGQPIAKDYKVDY